MKIKKRKKCLRQVYLVNNNKRGERLIGNNPLY
jgi:hypothetical protein